MKDHVMISVERELIEKAKKEKINVSSAAEDGIISKINYTDLKDKEYPEEFAVNYPTDYWIAPDGKCRRRGEPQFFINENGVVVPVSKQEYIKRLNQMGRIRSSMYPIKPDKRHPSVIPNFALMEK